MYIESIQTIAPDGRVVKPVSPPQPQRIPVLRQNAKPDQAAVDKSQDRTEEIQKTLSEFNQAIEPFSISLKFSKDEDTGKIVVQMIDNKSGTTVHQFPEEAMLHVSAILGKIQGRIFNQKA